MNVVPAGGEQLARCVACSLQPTYVVAVANSFIAHTMLKPSWLPDVVGELRKAIKRQRAG